ncbi:hypothetical protein RCG19_12670 [Neobacillus sp. OS1-2]|nr:hypothetical protein [Neobacillus sp. OS1-2]WML38083.1 hypothetical protein RCG19_12670 [Neobacillus sp. OS1-2]
MKSSCPFHKSILTPKDEQIMNKPLIIEILGEQEPFTKYFVER